MMDRRTVIGLVGVAPVLVAAGVPMKTPPPSSFLFTDFARTRFAPEVKRVYTAGYAMTGRHAAAYMLDPDQNEISAAGRALLARLVAKHTSARQITAARDAVIALESRFRARSADGRWFLLNEANPVAGHFGAVGDGTFDEAKGTFAGSDDTAALQALIDWTLFWSPKSAWIRIGAGAFRTTRPIYVGRNSDYHGVTIEGDGASFGAGFAGTRIFADHDAGPAIALTGILRGGVSNVAIFGRAAHWIEGNALGQLARQPLVDDLVLSAWSNPILPRQCESRHAPYAGVAIDPFRGARPDDGYDVRADVPAWLGAEDHYGEAFSSSEVALEKVAIRGFNTAFVIQPCASDGNGDFVRFRDCAVNACVHGWSIGNSQSRAVEIHSSTANAIHTVIDTAAHGARNGCLQGRITLLSVSNAIQLFDFSNGLAVVGPATFENLYCEALYRLGEIGPGSAADSALAFVDSQMGFQLIGPRGVPRYILGCERNTGYGPGGAQGRVRFERCRLVEFGPVLTLLVAARFTDTLVGPAVPDGPDDWRLRALRISAGGLATAGLALPVGDADLRFSDPGDHSSKTIAAVSTIYGTQPDRPIVVNIDKANLAKTRYESGEWHFTMPRTATAIRSGALLLDLTSGIVFFVRDIEGQQVVAIQQTALTSRGGPAGTAFVPISGVAALAN